MWHGGSKSVDVRFFAFLFRHFLQLIWFKILVTEYKDLFLNELRLVSLEQSWQVRKGNKKFQNICVIMSSKQLPTTITRLFCNFAGLFCSVSNEPNSIKIGLLLYKLWQLQKCWIEQSQNRNPVLPIWPLAHLGSNKQCILSPCIP